MFSNVISSGITLAKVLSGLSKSINIAKEVIPLYESVKPMIGSDKNYFKYLLHKETYIFKKSKNFKTLKNIIYLFLKTI